MLEGWKFKITGDSGDVQVNMRSTFLLQGQVQNCIELLQSQVIGNRYLHQPSPAHLHHQLEPPLGPPCEDVSSQKWGTRMSETGPEVRVDLDHWQLRSTIQYVAQ